jgi:hypothetical protein
MKQVLQVCSILIAAATTPAFADTLRCGSSLIKEGDSAGYVVEKCGEPGSKQTFTEPVYAHRENGTSYEIGTTTKDVWRYTRSSRQFPAVLTFEKGVLRKLEFEK